MQNVNTAPEIRLKEYCIRQKLTVALTESCTGGAVSSRIVSVPHASEYFLGSVVAYCDSVKKEMLKVSEDSLARYTACSKEVALEMLAGIQGLLKPSLAVSITGLAGPRTESDPALPVGSVYVALAKREEVPEVISLFFQGTRVQVIEQTVVRVLEEMIKHAGRDS